MDRVDVAKAEFFIFTIKGVDLTCEGTEGAFLQGNLGHIMDQVGEVTDLFRVPLFDDLKKSINTIGEYFPRFSLGAFLKLFSCEPKIAEDSVQLVGVYGGGVEECADLYEGLLQIEVKRVVGFLLFHGDLLLDFKVK